MRFSRPLFGLAVGLWAAGGSLSAQDLSYGLQASVTLPTSDLARKEAMDDALGFGLGAHMVVALPKGHAIVPRVDYTRLEKGGPTRKVQMAQIGAEYRYYWAGHVHQGLYTGGGAGYGVAKFEAGGRDDTPGAAFGSVVAGWQFTPHLGTEARYVWSRFKPKFDGVEREITSPTVNLSFLYRF